MSDSIPSADAPARRDDIPRRRTPGVLRAVLENNLLVALILFLAIVLLVIGPELFVQDSWLTLVSGREVVQHGLPHRETLTAIPFGRVWTDQQWLAHITFYGLDRVGGLGLVVVFHALLVSAAFAVTVTVSRLRGASARMTLVGAVVCLFVAPWSWQLRAQSMGLPLFAITLGLVAADRRLAARRTLLVFPLLVLWANIHGSVIMGALLVSAAGLLGLVGFLGLESGMAAPRARAALFLLAPWACVLASPYGTDLVAYYRLLLIDSPVSKYVQEWKAPTPSGYFLVFFGVALAAVVIAIWQRRRLSPYDLLVLAMTLASALRSARGVVWFSLAVAMLLPLALDGLTPASPSPPLRRRLGVVLTAFLAALLAATVGYALARGDGWYEKAWPQRAARETLRAAEASGVGAAVWPSDRYADWLLWKEPSLRGRVAWDVRFELLDAAEIQSIVDFKHERPGWQRIVDAYPVLVLDRASTRDQADVLAEEPGTTTLFEDKALVVLVRNGS